MADKEETDYLYKQADLMRKEKMGDEIYLRGIVEFSNYCVKDCNYCGIRRSNKQVTRYRLTLEDILTVCKKMETVKQTTVVLQSGEDSYYTKEKMGDIISAIRSETSLAITVSSGERDIETYAYWKAKGMDRYLLRFETSSPDLFAVCHPDDDLDYRLRCLANLKMLGVQTGSGFLIGLPKETLAQLSADILFATSLELDMIGVGPFIAHESTPFKGAPLAYNRELYFRVIAILRLLNPKAHIPATTAFDALLPEGRDLLLARGANVFMPNMTPQPFRQYYQLYPGKPCLDEDGDDCAFCILGRINRLGRKVGNDAGHSKRI